MRCPRAAEMSMQNWQARGSRKAVEQKLKGKRGSKRWLCYPLHQGEKIKRQRNKRGKRRGESEECWNELTGVRDAAGGSSGGLMCFLSLHFLSRLPAASASPVPTATQRPPRSGAEMLRESPSVTPADST